jgi:hypothetical protein
VPHNTRLVYDLLEFGPNQVFMERVAATFRSAGPCGRNPPTLASEINSALGKSMDATSAEMLAELEQTLRASRIEL